MSFGSALSAFQANCRDWTALDDQAFWTSMDIKENVTNVDDAWPVFRVQHQELRPVPSFQLGPKAGRLGYTMSPQDVASFKSSVEQREAVRYEAALKTAADQRAQEQLAKAAALAEAAKQGWTVGRSCSR